MPGTYVAAARGFLPATIGTTRNAMSEHTVYLKVRDEWQEVSRHDDRDDALSAMHAALAKKPSGTTVKIEPGGELFMVTAEGAVIEVMQD
jgi:hypothetical protein